MIQRIILEYLKEKTLIVINEVWMLNLIEVISIILIILTLMINLIK